MNETPQKNHPDYLRGWCAAQDALNGAESEPSREDQESPEFLVGWKAFQELRGIFVRNGFIEKDGVFSKTFSIGGK